MENDAKRNGCSAPGCTRGVHARGLCQMHYDHLRKRQGVRTDDSRRAEARAGPWRKPDPFARAACSVPGCDAPHHAKGYCKSHYSRLRRRGHVRETRVSQADVCEIAGCSNPIVRNRRCGEHLQSPNGVRHMTKDERLAEIRRRHEFMRREIERIRRTFGKEREEDG